MTHEAARTIMRRIANDYDRLAKLAEDQLAAEEKRKRLNEPNGRALGWAWMCNRGPQRQAARRRKV